MRKTITLNCAECRKEVVKELREYKRRIKAGKTDFFCDLSCARKKDNRMNPRPGNPANLQANNRKDEYTPFRWYVLRGEYRDRNKGYGCDLNVIYLKKLWEEQNGICPITGWNLILPKDTAKAWDINNPSNASLDRIDNSKGYMQGNVRYIAFMANIARSSFTDEQLIEFCKAVAENQK